MDETMQKHIKQIGKTGRLYANRLRGKQQINTIRHKYHHEGKSAAIKQRNGKEMAIKGSYPCARRIAPDSAKNGSPKRWVSEKPQKYPFFAISCPKFALFTFRWTIIRKSTLNGLKRLKRQKRHFTKFNILFKVL